MKLILTLVVGAGSHVSISHITLFDDLSVVGHLDPDQLLLVTHIHQEYYHPIQVYGQTSLPNVPWYHCVHASRHNMRCVALDL